MDADRLKARYAENLKMSLTVRRYMGQGTARAPIEAAARAAVRGYSAQELIGNIQQGDQNAVVYVQDLVDHGLDMPVTADDKVFFDGQELQVIAPEPRRALDGTIVAYELQLRG